MQESRDSAGILVFGAHSRLKEIIIRKLRKMNFEVISRTEAEAGAENCVIIVPDLNQGESKNWQEFLELAELLERICAVKPRTVLLVSNTKVYGKVYGNRHALKEDETGYVCHTAPRDNAAQCMRMLEHLCSRLAREDGFPVKIVRADWEHILGASRGPDGNSGEEREDGGGFSENLAEAMVRVMQSGVPGEAYNLSAADECRETGSGQPEGEIQQELSPLSPIPIMPDAGKAGML